MPGFPILRLCILTLRPRIPNGPCRATCRATCRSNLPKQPAAAVPGFVPGWNAPARRVPAGEEKIRRYEEPVRIGPDGFSLFWDGVGGGYNASATT